MSCLDFPLHARTFHKRLTEISCSFKSMKLESVNSNISNCSYLLKRKKSSEDSNDVRKHQKSTIFSLSDNVNNDEDEKGMARKIRNKESAHLSRQIKKHYVKELEKKFIIFHSTIQHLNANLSYAMAENVTLKAQLRGTGVPAQVSPPPKIYLYPPPWMSYTPSYMMSRQGSQVPLVPIPKLKSQALAPMPKISKNVEKKKSEVKTKKVASVSFLGVLFFMMLFGGLVPLLKLRYGGPVNEIGYSRKYGGKDHSSHCGRGGHGESNQKNTNKAAYKFVHVGNGSDPLAASLYVPRNDKLVEIDGNLIIQYISASDKAMAFHESADKKNREAGLTVPGDLAPVIPGIHPRLYRSLAMGQIILGSKEKENVKSKMQEWYLEGLAGLKSLSRIFVVVLIDSVKYVTYSCILPFKGSAPLVNALEDGVFM
ncbi:hypothetical protein MTR67_019429 [Solanum verrucosum]|uniref:BZIP domain-containing protein n=1 Tax=Solanum verrucosum TaxID=315347 RepID=A0AAF0QU95_SOLVR|nr:hypothetical protein MTR67_019429 [Solanum verrucosum]